MVRHVLINYFCGYTQGESYFTPLLVWVQGIANSSVRSVAVPPLSLTDSANCQPSGCNLCYTPPFVAESKSKTRKKTSSSSPPTDRLVSSNLSGGSVEGFSRSSNARLVNPLHESLPPCCKPSVAYTWKLLTKARSISSPGIVKTHVGGVPSTPHRSPPEYEEREFRTPYGVESHTRQVSSSK